MISTTTTVGTTAVKLLDASNSWRTVYLHVEGNGSVYLGGSNVTTANGLPTEKHTTPIEFYIPAEEELWAVAIETQDLRILKPALYAD
jgi:hypothetical protein